MKIKNIIIATIIAVLLGNYYATSSHGQELKIHLVPGTTSGDFQVTSAGAATYTIPIQTTAGTAGMQPAISLQYSSQSVQTEVGFGWSLAGLSSITRGPKNLLDDGHVQGVKLDVSDAYFMDGQRLVLIDSNHSENPDEYITQINNYSRIKTTGEDQNGPKSFVVETKAGLTMYFGQTNNSKVKLNGITYIWLANRIEDSFGNYIEFEYLHPVESEGTYHINNIRYTGNNKTGLAPYASLSFEYEKSPHSREKWFIGKKIIETNRLKAIVSKFEGDLYKKYTLTYLDETPDGYRVEKTNNFYLASVQEQGSNDAFRATKFHYQFEEPSVTPGWYEQPEPSDLPPFNSSSNKETSYVFQDVDSDGNLDFLYSEIVNGKWQRKFFKGTGSSWLEDNNSGFFPNVPFASDTDSFQQVMFSDINKDGKIDFLFFGLKEYKPAVYLNTGTGWERHSRLSDLPEQIFRYSNIAENLTLFDADDDGKLDLVYRQDNQFDAVTFLQTSSGWVGSELHQLPKLEQTPEKQSLVLFDSNCDQKTELGLIDLTDGQISLRPFEATSAGLKIVEDSNRTLVVDDIVDYSLHNTVSGSSQCDLIAFGLKTMTGENNIFYSSSPDGWKEEVTLSNGTRSLYSDARQHIVSVNFINYNNDDDKDLLIAARNNAGSVMKSVYVQKKEASGNKWEQITSGGFDRLPIFPEQSRLSLRIIDIVDDARDEIFITENLERSFAPQIWGQSTGKWEETNLSRDIPVHLAKWNQKTSQAQFVDLNADGLLDIVTKSKSFQNTGYEWKAYSNRYVPPKEFSNESGQDSGVRIVDINADGLPDFIYAALEKDGTFTSIVKLNDGKDWVDEVTFGTSFGKSLSIRNTAFTRIGDGVNGTELIDINGDARVDVIVGVRDNNLNSNHYALINNGVSWVSNEIAEQYQPCIETNNKCVDFAYRSARDLKKELIFPKKKDSPIEFAQRSTGTQFIDLNGDGLTDILYAYRNIDMQWGTQDEIDVVIEKWEENNPNLPLPKELETAKPNGVDKFHNRIVYKGALINTGSGWKDGRDRYSNLKYRLDGEPERMASNESLVTYLIDHNSDGLIDLHFAKRSTGTRTTSSYSNSGNGFVAETSSWKLPVSLIPNFSGDFGFQFADVNGDTKVDILQRIDNENGNIDVNHNTVWLNTGTGWSNKVSKNYLLKEPLARRNRGDQGTRLVDVNGDGIVDIIRSYIGHTRGQDNSPEKRVWINNAQRVPLIRSITDGLDNEVKIYYQPLSQSEEGEEAEKSPNFKLYKAGKEQTRYPLIRAQPPAYLVKKTEILVPGYISASDIATVRYSYSGFKVNLLSGTPIGFESFTQENLTTRSYTSSFFHQECPEEASRWETCKKSGKTYAVEKGMVLGGDRIPLKQQKIIWLSNKKTFSEIPGQPPIYELVVRRTTEEKFDIDLSTPQKGASMGRLVEEFWYDADIKKDNIIDRDSLIRSVGNLETSRSTLNEREQTLIENHLYGDNEERWFLGRLLESRVTKKNIQTGEQEIRDSCFTYHPETGILLTEASLCHHPKQVTTYYSHDGYGNVINTKISATDIETRSQKSVFDKKGRYVLETENTLGHTTKVVEFDEVRMLSLQTVDANGLANKTNFDDFGRVTSTTDPTGVQKEIKREFIQGHEQNGAICNSRECYEVKSQIFAGTKKLPPSVTTFDAANRQVKSQTIGFDGKKVEQLTIYNGAGDIVRTSLPFFVEDISSLGFRYDIANLQQYEATQECSALYENGALADKLQQERKLTQSSYKGIKWSHYFYDELGRSKYLIGPDGSLRCFEYAGRETKAYDAKGRVRVSVVDTQKRPILVTDAAGGNLSFQYDVSGRLIKTTNVDGSQIHNIYDKNTGEKVESIDPDLGRWRYKHNSIGELKSQEDAKGQITILHYDLLGRLIKKEEQDKISKWYFDKSDTSLGLLYRVEGDGFIEDYTYDKYNRPSITSTRIANDSFDTAQTYDSFGRVNSNMFPSGVLTRNEFDEYGFNNAVYVTKKDGTDIKVWQAIEYDSDGRLIKDNLGNGIDNSLKFEPETGFLLQKTFSLNQSKLQDFSFKYDLVGNMLKRNEHIDQDYRVNSFDVLDRITSATYNSGANKVSVTYDSFGNILNKSDFGEFHYGALPENPIHSVSSVLKNDGTIITYQYDKNGNTLVSDKGKFSYTASNLVKSIQKGKRQFSTFSYAPNGMRYFHDYRDDRRHVKTTYIGAFEQIVEIGTKPFLPTSERTRFRHHIPTASSAVIVYEEIDWKFPTRHSREFERFLSTEKPEQTGYRTDNFRYLLTDNLGSISVITDEFGNVIDKLRYDPWGKRLEQESEKDRHYSLRRGFTGHEHIDHLKLIHMNGRVYDPDLARFVSADPNIQSPSNSQSYNRYSYVLNNPYKYTDPSGYFFKKLFKAVFDPIAKAVSAAASAVKKVGKWFEENWKQVAVVVVAVAVTYCTGGAGAVGMKAVLAGMAGGAAAGATGAALYGGDLSDIFEAAFTGAVIGGITAGLVSAWGGGGDSIAKQLGFAQNSIGRAAGHGVIGGLGSEMRGGEFLAGFASAGFTHYATGALNVDGIRGFDGDQIARVSVDATIGGTASVLGGGKFANGAFAGAFQRFFNDETSKREVRRKYEDILKTGNIDIDANVEQARNMSLKQWIAKVKSGGDWDYKQLNHIMRMSRFDPARLDEFGNFHFGIMANAHGFNLEASLYGAGAYQSLVQGGGNLGHLYIATRVLSSTAGGYLLPDSISRAATRAGFTWGDNPGDSQNIMNGWDYGQKNY